jgi:rubrerythrin
MNLEGLTEHARRVERTIRPETAKRDSAAALAPERRQGWARFLSSIATTESIEGLLLEPLKESFKDEPAVLEYLEAHASDERRHFEIFRDYVRETFGHEKRGRTFSDRVVYDTLLPGVAWLARRRPLCALAMLRFYEEFSVEFYSVLKLLAERDGLSGLLGHIRAIEKDELRHLAGLEELIRKLVERGGGARASDVWLSRGILRVLLVDIDTRGWALHNRRVRSNALAIGIDPGVMSAQAERAAAASIEFLRKPRRA